MLFFRRFCSTHFFTSVMHTRCWLSRIFQRKCIIITSRPFIDVWIFVRFTKIAVSTPVIIVLLSLALFRLVFIINITGVVQNVCSPWYYISFKMRLFYSRLAFFSALNVVRPSHCIWSGNNSILIRCVLFFLLQKQLMHQLQTRILSLTKIVRISLKCPLMRLFKEEKVVHMHTNTIFCYRGNIF